MGAGTFTLFARAKEFLGDGTFDIDGNTFKALFVSAGYAPADSHSILSQISSSEIVASGYARVTLTLDYTGTGSTKTKCTCSAFEVSGTGTKKAKRLVIYNDSIANDPPLGYLDLETTSTTGVEATKIIVTFPNNVLFKAS